MKFRDIFTEDLRGIEDYVKELKKCKTIKSADLNNRGFIDIRTTGTVKEWEIDGTRDCMKKIGYVLIHAYRGLSGKFYEIGPKNHEEISKRFSYRD